MISVRRPALSLMGWVLIIALLIAPFGTANAQAIPASYALVAENEPFQLHVDSTTLAFKLLDKRSGYVWHSGIDELIDGDRLNTSWRTFAQGGLSIEYLDARAVNRRASLGNSPHRLEVTPIERGISASVWFEEYDITVGMRLQLEADGVRVEVPFDMIHEGEAGFRLGRVYVYPFMGATRGGSVPGYMLLPDGTGSVIRFAETTRANNMFYGRYYGDDLGISAVMPWDPFINSPLSISFPVFGMVHGEGENAFLSVVEQGAGYGEVQVHPAGIITNFNFLYHAFIYNEPYFQATNRSGAGVTTVQRQPNAFDAVIHYRFLTGETADYVGMARDYQAYLVERGQLSPRLDANPNIGVRLEFLGGDKERVLLWDRFISTTTLGQMRAMLDSLDLPNAEVIYYGWQPFGAYTMPPTTLILEGALGSVDELRATADEIAANGGHFSLYFEPQVALWDEPGYSPRTDVAMAITNVSLEGYNRAYSLYFTLDALQRRTESLARDIAAHGEIGLALDGIGWLLYSDFRESAPIDREETIAAYQRLLRDTPLRLGLYTPNDYLFEVTRAYYDMPLGDNGYIYTTEAVPFLPIVLAGYLPSYGTALNFSPDMQTDLLRHVEYGVYPSYFLTHEPTATILNTRSNWIYTSSYEQWGEEIRRAYAWLNALLAPVRGQPIVAHGRLAEGVYATTYANGRQIVVNYTDRPFTHSGMTVEARNALLVENAP